LLYTGCNGLPPLGTRFKLVASNEGEKIELIDMASQHQRLILKQNGRFCYMLLGKKGNMIYKDVP